MAENGAWIGTRNGRCHCRRRNWLVILKAASHLGCRSFNLRDDPSLAGVNTASLGQGRAVFIDVNRDAAARLGMAHVDMAFESRGAPQRDRILRFYDLYQSIAFPALMHCKSGADRTGLAGGLALLFEGGTAAQALGQLSMRFGHFNRSPTGVLDAFFLHYQATAEGRVPFIDWVRDEYDEVAVRTRFRAHGLATFLNDAVLRRE